MTHTLSLIRLIEDVMEPQTNEERIKEFNPVFLYQCTLGDRESGEDSVLDSAKSTELFDVIIICP